MKKSSLTRRSFIKKTSAGLAGAALTAAGTSSLYGNVVKKAAALAVLGGNPVRTKPFLSTWPIYDKSEEKALLKALRSGNWCCLKGDFVYKFEKDFAQAMDVPYSAASNGGTTALYTSLQALGIAPGDEVITTPRTFIATVNVILNSHALPVFVDIDPETSLINADLIEDAITEHTKAIIPVHLSGYPADIVKIMSIANKYNIPVVEDACQSVFAAVNNKKVGTFGVTGCISFNEWKSLVCGDGGAVIGSDKELMRRCAAFINNGRDPTPAKRGQNNHPYPGSNLRITEFQGAVLSEQFERFKKQDDLRQRNGKYLQQNITEIPGIKHRKVYSKNTRITYISFVLDYNKEYFNNLPATKFAEAVQAEGIPIRGSSGSRGGGGCHKEGMLEDHLNSRAFQASFSRARLKNYRESLQFPVLDNPNRRETLSFSGKTAFLGPKKDMDDIIEAITKVVKNIDKLT